MREGQFEFGDFRVDPVRRILIGADGQPIHLKPKAFNTLLYLVEHPHEVIDKHALLNAVWPNVIVEENSLTQAISQLRHALGEHPGEHRYILTEPGLGYRFIAPVNRVFDNGEPSDAVRRQVVGSSLPLRNALTPGSAADPPTQTPASGDQRLRTGRIAAVALAVLFMLAMAVWLTNGQRDLRSIAVLPFENLSASAGNTGVVAALHDDILTALAKIRDLKVIAPASVMQYPGPDRNLREVGEQLGAATALEGTVQNTAGIVHLNVRLVDTRTAELLWTEGYDLNPSVLGEAFAVQTDIAKRIANILDISVAPADMERIGRRPTESSKAYEFYLSGRRYAKGSDLLRDLPAAVQQFERAVEEDPGFALALARLSIENIHMYWTMDHTETRREMAESAVRRALDLQPDLPEAHLAMAWFHYQGHLDYDAALRELAIAEQGLPGDADLLFARSVIYTRMGKLNEALPSWERVVELDPRNPNLLRQYASVQKRLRNYAVAERYLDRVIEIAPDAVEAKTQKANIPWLRDGDTAPYLEAIRGNPLLRPSEALLGEWSVWVWERNYEAALRVLAELDAEFILDSRLYYRPLASLYALTYELAGQHDLAIEQFELARTHLESVLAQTPDDPRIMLRLAEALAGLGQAEASKSLALRAIDRAPAAFGPSDAAEYRLHAVCGVLTPIGAVDTALEHLDIYLAGPGFMSIEALSRDPELDPLRKDPRFAMLVEKYRRK